MTSYAPTATEFPLIVGRRWGEAEGLFTHGSFQKDWSEADHPRGGDGRFIDGFGDVPADSLSDWFDTTGPVWGHTIAEIRSQGMGNCFQSAGTLLLGARSLGLKNPTVIHATVLGDGGAVKGIRYGHGWLEADGPKDAGGRLVFDFASGGSTILPRSAYYALGKVEDVHSYTEQQAMDKLFETMNYGPWGWAPPNTGMLDKESEHWD